MSLYPRYINKDQFSSVPSCYVFPEDMISELETLVNRFSEPGCHIAHIRCHLSGRASPSRTSSCRNPDSLLALRNYFAGREREARQVKWHVYESKDEEMAALTSSIYRKAKG